MKKKIILGNCYLNGFGTFDPVTLTFDPVTPKYIGFLCCPGQMCEPSLRKVGQGVLELLIGNEKVTDGETDLPTYRPTDRPTDMRNAIFLLRRGGIISVFLINESTNEGITTKHMNK